MDLPMLDEAEYESISRLMSECLQATKAFREKHGLSLKGLGVAERFAPALAEFKRITGFEETNHNAIPHHRVSLYGLPCQSCGKPMRSPKTRRCGACGTSKSC